LALDQDMMLARWRHRSETASSADRHPTVGFGQVVLVEAFAQLRQLVNHRHSHHIQSKQVSTTSALDPSELLSNHLLLLLELVEFDVTGVKSAVKAGQLLDQLRLARLRRSFRIAI
jgi:hypothetical protein